MNGLDRFIDDHLGCGNLSAPIWFIGPEPAGAGTREDLQARVSDFIAQGCAPITNLRKSLYVTGDTRFFEPEVPEIQKYWAVVSRLWLQARGLNSVNKENVRSFQKHILCAPTNDEGPLMLETSSLPSKTTSNWPYAEWSEVQEHQTRKTYLVSTIPTRMRKINDLMNEQKPKLVICFGNTYKDRWAMLKASVGTTLKVITHPNGRPTLKNEDWDRIGHGLRSYL